eukprot:jgi/Chlat1/8393/Chrsp80S07828
MAPQMQGPQGTQAHLPPRRPAAGTGSFHPNIAGETLGAGCQGASQQSATARDKSGWLRSVSEPLPYPEQTPSSPRARLQAAAQRQRSNSPAPVRPVLRLPRNAANSRATVAAAAAAAAVAQGFHGELGAQGHGGALPPAAGALLLQSLVSSIKTPHILITNVSASASEERLSALLGAYGRVASLHLLRSQEAALASMETVGEATAAVSLLNNSWLLGSRLMVTFLAQPASEVALVLSSPVPTFPEVVASAARDAAVRIARQAHAGTSYAGRANDLRGSHAHQPAGWLAEATHNTGRDPAETIRNAWDAHARQTIGASGILDPFGTEYRFGQVIWCTPEGLESYAQKWRNTCASPFDTEYHLPLEILRRPQREPPYSTALLLFDAYTQLLHGLYQQVDCVPAAGWHSAKGGAATAGPSHARRSVAKFMLVRDCPPLVRWEFESIFPSKRVDERMLPFRLDRRQMQFVLEAFQRKENIIKQLTENTPGVSPTEGQEGSQWGSNSDQQSGGSGPAVSDESPPQPSSAESVADNQMWPWQSEAPQQHSNLPQRSDHSPQLSRVNSGRMAPGLSRVDSLKEFQRSFSLPLEGQHAASSASYLSSEALGLQSVPETSGMPANSLAKVTAARCSPLGQRQPTPQEDDGVQEFQALVAWVLHRGGPVESPKDEGVMVAENQSKWDDSPSDLSEVLNQRLSNGVAAFSAEALHTDGLAQLPGASASTTDWSTSHDQQAWSLQDSLNLNSSLLNWATADEQFTGRAVESTSIDTGRASPLQSSPDARLARRSDTDKRAEQLGVIGRRSSDSKPAVHSANAFSSSLWNSSIESQFAALNVRSSANSLLRRSHTAEISSNASLLSTPGTTPSTSEGAEEEVQRMIAFLYQKDQTYELEASATVEYPSTTASMHHSSSTGNLRASTLPSHMQNGSKGAADWLSAVRRQPAPSLAASNGASKASAGPWGRKLSNLRNSDRPWERSHSGPVACSQPGFAAFTNAQESSSLKNSAAMCVVCRVQQSTTAVLPCGHRCLCSDDAEHIRVNSGLCPICCGRFESAVVIHDI